MRRLDTLEESKRILNNLGIDNFDDICVKLAERIATLERKEENFTLKGKYVETQDLIKYPQFSEGCKFYNKVWVDRAKLGILRRMSNENLAMSWQRRFEQIINEVLGE